MAVAVHVRTRVAVEVCDDWGLLVCMAVLVRVTEEERLPEGHAVGERVARIVTEPEGLPVLVRLVVVVEEDDTVVVELRDCQPEPVPLPVEVELRVLLAVRVVVGVEAPLGEVLALTLTERLERIVGLPGKLPVPELLVV